MEDDNRTDGPEPNGGRVIDPSDAGGAFTVAEPERKRKSRSDAGKLRGPRSGSAQSSPRASTKTAKASLDLSSLQGLLIGTSAMLAMKMGHEEIALTEDEASRFLTAAQNVARHYSVETTQRTLDWVAFFGVSAQVVGTRVVSVMVKQSKARREREPVSPGASMNGAHATPLHIVPQGPEDYDQ